MNRRLTGYLGLSIASVSLLESLALAIDVKDLESQVIVSEEQQDVEIGTLQRGQIVEELTKIQDELNDLRAEALRQGDVETLQEITFVIRYAERVKDYEDLKVMNAEKENFKKFKEHISQYLKDFANK